MFWKWITPKVLGIVTNTAAPQPLDPMIRQALRRLAREDPRILTRRRAAPISYKAPSEDMQWFTLIGIAAGDASRPAPAPWTTQLYSVAQQRSQALDAHGAAPAPGDAEGAGDPPSWPPPAPDVASGRFGGVEASRRIELGAPERGQTPFTKRTTRSVLSA